MKATTIPAFVLVQLLQLYSHFRFTSQSASPSVKQAMYTLNTLCNVSISDLDLAANVSSGVTHCASLCLSSAACVAFNYTDLGGCWMYQGNLTFAEVCSSANESEENVTSLYVNVDELPLTNTTQANQTNPTEETTETIAPLPPVPPTPTSSSASSSQGCHNGGVYDGRLAKCNCTGGWLGDHCNETATGCLALADAGYRTDSNYTVHPPSSENPFEVYCSIALGFGLTTIQMRHQESAGFNRSWQEYKDGFRVEDKWSDFWLGNDRIHYLTSRGDHTLVLHVKNDTTEYQRYFVNFVMANESYDYAVTYASSWSPDQKMMGDCWPGTSLPFSTYDRDNDGDSDVNCASSHGAGWWFESTNSCTSCNINGVFLKGGPYTGSISEAFVSKVPPDFKPTSLILSLWLPLS